MFNKVYILIEEHRFIKPRRFSIIAVYDSPESAIVDFESYSQNITSSDYPFEIKLEEREVKSDEYKN